MFLIDVREPDSADDPSAPRARYNIAPTQAIDLVIQRPGEEREIARARWGLIPSWADDVAIGNRMINARGETVESKPSFRNAFAKRRCLIPADGYYEWKKVADGKQPYLIRRPDDDVMAMAGLWEDNSKATDDKTSIRSCTVITTEANETTSAIHNRMPVILGRHDFDRWLDPNFRDIDALKRLLKPADEALLQCDAVSRRVNSPKHDDAACIEPAPKNTLF